jgi:hypothetical protein
LKLLSVNPCSEYSNLPMQLVIKTKMFNKTTQLFDGFLSLPMDVNENVTVSAYVLTTTSTGNTSFS